MNIEEPPISPESKRQPVKICGLTVPDEAVQCEAAGASAIGLVFYPPSPRCVSMEQARSIRAALSSATTVVGVFVNEPRHVILNTVRQCNLNAVQLHGRETPEMVSQLRDEGIMVIKSVFLDHEPFFTDVAQYPALAFLAECGRGRLPGGNALAWKWEMARSVSQSVPLILAGGLNPENVRLAMHDAWPDAVDVSSGIEFCPGRKDIRRVRLFIQAASGHIAHQHNRRLFT
ncbi:MAG: phosphoribosylanthranilate isomerase [Desulfatirhabdiaceae bacterium]